MYSCEICNSESNVKSIIDNCCKAQKITYEPIENEIYQTVIDRFGEKKQVGRAIEELSELIKELIRFINGDERFCRYKTIDEIADVRIVLTQLIIIFSDDSEIEQQIEKKLEKLRTKYLS